MAIYNLALLQSFMKTMMTFNLTFEHVLLSKKIKVDGCLGTKSKKKNQPSLLLTLDKNLEKIRIFMCEFLI